MAFFSRNSVLTIRILFLAMAAPFYMRADLPESFHNFSPVRNENTDAPPAKKNLISRADNILSARFFGKLFFRTRCYKRSLVLYRLLRHYGYDPIVHVGVDHNNGSPLAHVWLTIDGSVVPEPPYAERNEFGFKEFYRIQNGVRMAP